MVSAIFTLAMDDLSWAINLDLGGLTEDSHPRQDAASRQLNETEELLWPELDPHNETTDALDALSLFALDVFDTREDAWAADLQEVGAISKRRRAEDDDGWFAKTKRRETRAQDASDRQGIQELPFDKLTPYFPELFPSLPLQPLARHSMPVNNPFKDGCMDRYSSALRLTFELPADGGVNGYIKFRIRKAQEAVGPRQKEKLSETFGGSELGVHHRSVPTLEAESVKLLPRDFGSASRMDPTERKLFTFYTEAFCTGRTLITKSNFWLKDIAAVADQNPCVRHALLASTAAYVLDYIPSNLPLRQRANMHYNHAVKLLTDALAAEVTSTQVQDKEIPVVATLLLLSCDDVVNWELNTPQNLQPKWLQGTTMAKIILDRTDPGYRYWKARNVQTSRARDALANRIAFMSILAQPVSPLEADHSRRFYGWLLEGTEEETRSVRAGTGLCPKLLHAFAQVTHIAARILETPDTYVFEAAIKKIERRLASLHQRSELSDGYQDPLELHASCVLDGDGKVSTIREVTELTAEAWRAAAQLYLQCRLLRKPRYHPDVLVFMDILRGCIERMPYTGPLFSSQAPFFPVYLLATLSYRPEDRRVATEWFEVVTSGAGCRSSVPPIWKILQRMWTWMSTHLTEGFFDPHAPIKAREPWWEHVVGYLVEHEGVISLC